MLTEAFTLVAVTHYQNKTKTKQWQSKVQMTSRDCVTGNQSNMHNPVTRGNVRPFDTVLCELQAMKRGSSSTVKGSRIALLGSR